MSETLPSPEHAPPVAAPVAPVEQKLHGVLGAMSEAVAALLDTHSVDRFGRAARLCVMGQKISGELVATIKDAKKVRALDHEANALLGGMGPEAQYVAQGGGNVNALAEDYADHEILNPPAAGAFVGQQGAIYAGGGFGGDQTQMMRDLMMMLQGVFSDQKKAREEKSAAPDSDSRYRLYSELNELLRARDALKAPGDAPLLERVQKHIEQTVDLIAKGNPDASIAPPPDTDVVLTELLRGHPSGAGEQWGDAGHPRGTVLHREDRGDGAPHGGPPHGDLEVVVG